MKKNQCTDYFTELNPLSCETSCCGLTGRHVSNYPIITRVYPSNNKSSETFTHMSGFSASVVVEGYNFLNTTDVVLSASDNTIFSALTTVDKFSTKSSISATFTSFTGYKITSFAKPNNHTITFDMPAITAPTSGATINIILLNPIGHNIPFISEDRHRIHIS